MVLVGVRNEELPLDWFVDACLEPGLPGTVEPVARDDQVSTVISHHHPVQVDSEFWPGPNPGRVDQPQRMITRRRRDERERQLLVDRRDLTRCRDGTVRRTTILSAGMSTGTAYEEGSVGSPHYRLNRMARGWTQFWLGQEMRFEPGTGWHYDSGGVIVLSSIFQRTTGVHVDDFVREHVFASLGIERYEWERNAEGHPHAGGGLHLRPRDLAKIGQLMLQGGEWKDRQVVPAAWVERSPRTKFRFDEQARPFHGYAYLWWVFAPDPAVPEGSPIVAGTGLGGQYVFWIPDHDMVVVALGWSDDAHESQGPIRFLYKDILPAVW